MAAKVFPKGFLWGAATSAYQVEGGIENCDWAQAARDGRVPVCGRACDHYNRYEEDFDIAKKLGHNAHRLSVEWARIEPKEGTFDEQAIEHYRKVLKALRVRGIEPFVTLWHFTLPEWFAESGGFERRDAPRIFARYALFVVRKLEDLCSHFSTMNEPNVFATQGWINGEWAPFKISAKPWKRVHTANTTQRDKALFGVQYLNVVEHLAKAHNAAYAAVRQSNNEVKLGIVKHIHVYLPTTGLRNIVRTKLSNYFQNKRFLRKTIHQIDEIGVNFYQATRYGTELTDKKTDMGWNFTPERIYEALMLVADYKKPMFVSEAGVADEDDSDRAEYIKKQAAATLRAIQDGADVRGHMYWSLLDNYEWAHGFDKRFGLVAVNYETLERTIRPSAYVYKEIIEHNGLVDGG